MDSKPIARAQFDYVFVSDNLEHDFSMEMGGDGICFSIGEGALGDKQELWVQEVSLLTREHLDRGQKVIVV